MNIWEKLKTWNQRCRICKTDGITGGFVDQFPELKVVEPLKFGHLYKCEKCNEFWFLHEHKQWLDRIRPEYVPLVRHWNQNTLEIENSALSILSGIGGVPDSYKGYISIPCSIRNTAGHKHDKALILISKQPPFRWPEEQRVCWADEIDGIYPSVFALPFDVRRVSCEKEEEAMGFAPVGVLDKQGTEYTLACESYFFDYNGIKGEEIRLSGSPQKKWKRIIYPEPAQAYYFVDWFDQCEDLLVPSG